MLTYEMFIFLSNFSTLVQLTIVTKRLNIRREQFTRIYGLNFDRIQIFSLVLISYCMIDVLLPITNLVTFFKEGYSIANSILIRTYDFLH